MANTVRKTVHISVERFKCGKSKIQTADHVCCSRFILPALIHCRSFSIEDGIWNVQISSATISFFSLFGVRFLYRRLWIFGRRKPFRWIFLRSTLKKKKIHLLRNPSDRKQLAYSTNWMFAGNVTWKINKFLWCSNGYAMIFTCDK